VRQGVLLSSASEANRSTRLRDPPQRHPGHVKAVSSLRGDASFTRLEIFFGNRLSTGYRFPVGTLPLSLRSFVSVPHRVVGTPHNAARCASGHESPRSVSLRSARAHIASRCRSTRMGTNPESPNCRCAPAQRLQSRIPVGTNPTFCRSHFLVPAFVVRINCRVRRRRNDLRAQASAQYQIPCSRSDLIRVSHGHGEIATSSEHPV
jgi:hypothetical protein